MTLPDHPAARKPRRLGLYLPFALAAAAAVAWAGAWFWLRGEVVRRLDEAAADGRTLSWKSRTVGGFPFRMDVTFKGLKASEPTGWAILAPTLKAEAYAYALGHWVLVAPEGVTVVRPEGGPLVVKAKALRASASNLEGAPPKIAVEGVGLTFEPGLGGRPFFVSAARKLQLNLRSGPDDQGQVYLLLDGAKARTEGLFARIAGDKPISLTLDGVFDHASAFRGSDWRGAVQAWRDAGGAMRVQSLKVAAGEALLDARSGELKVGDDGRLRGSLSASLRRAPQALAAMGQAGAIAPEPAEMAAAVAAARTKGDAATMTIDFLAGETTLGPIDIGPAPRVY